MSEKSYQYQDIRKIVLIVIDSSEGDIMDLGDVIARTRKSVVAICRYRLIDAQTGQYQISFGSGFVVVDDRYVVTAFHNLNGGEPRDPQDRYVAFVVPDNLSQAHHFSIVGFPLELPDVDLAIIELGPCETPGIHIPALPVSFGEHADGAQVVTVGFPAPEVVGISIDEHGNYRGGNFFLKSHANEGMLAAQYMLGPAHMYEFNVGWHHGESGGPVVRMADPLAVITVMQHYRNIRGPHGIVPGPHRGIALSIIQNDLVKFGATIV